MKNFQPIRLSILWFAIAASPLTVTPATADEAFGVKSVTSYIDTGIMLTWASEPGALYEIQFSGNLASDSWKVLYSDMPSMGVSTFWTDAGDYAATPEILRPELTLRRFYRVTKVGQNTGVGPTLTFSDVIPGAVLSGVVAVTVTGSGSDGVGDIRLFIDGAEYDSRSNNPAVFTINTSEWRNGTHRFSASAVDRPTTGFQTTPSVGGSDPNYSATPGLEVSFQNYVSHFKFSEDLFEPEAGETQVISAKFEKNSNWTLEIRDETGALVRTAMGMGSSMSFPWDGNGEAGAILPQGSYDFSVSAQAVVSNGNNFRQLQTPEESGVAATPQRIPRKVKGVAGTVGIAWQGHHPDPPGPTFMRPLSGLPGQGRVTLVPTNISPPFGPLKRVEAVAKGFASEMKKGGWKTGFELGDNALEAKALRKPAKGGTSKFNEVNIGLLVGHGIRGESIDLVATNTGAFQTYFPVHKTGEINYDWVRLSECDFGSENLRWMGIYACNMLHETSYDSMYAKGVLPINDKLHILLGAKTSVFMYDTFGRKWASFMLGRENGNRESVIESWFSAGILIHEEVEPDIPVTFRIAGWPSCFGDKLTEYAEPSSDNVYDIEFRDRVIWTPP